MTTSAATGFVGSLRNGMVWTLLTTVVGAACQWLVVVVIARLGTAEQLGQYSLAMALYGPVVMFTRLNMRTVLVTDAASRYQIKDYLSVRLVLTLLGAVVTLLYVVVRSHDIELGILLGVVSYKSMESLADMAHGLLQKRERFDVIGNSTVVRGVALVGCLTAGLLWNEKYGLRWGLALSTLTWLLVTLHYDFRSAAVSIRDFLRWRFRVILRISRECFPTGIVMMLASLNLNVPIYFVAHDLGVSQVGYYSSVAYFITLGGLVATAVTQSAAAPMAEFFANDRMRFWSSLRVLLVYSTWLLLAGIAAAWVLGGWVLSTIYGHAYAHLGELLVWIAAAAGLSIPAAFLGLALTVARQFWYELLLTLFSVLVVTLVAWIFVPVRGISGAGMALAAGIACRALLSMLVLRITVGNQWILA